MLFGAHQKSCSLGKQSYRIVVIYDEDLPFDIFVEGYLIIGVNNLGEFRHVVGDKCAVDPVVDVLDPFVDLDVRVFRPVLGG